LLRRGTALAKSLDHPVEEQLKDPDDSETLTFKDILRVSLDTHAPPDAHKVT